MKRPRKTLLQTLDRLPPFVVYALARKGNHSKKRPPLEELVAASSLSYRTFLRIARKLSWKTIRIDQIESFCGACGVDLLRQRDQLDFIRRGFKYKRPLAHLRPQQWRNFEEACMALAKSKVSPEPSHQNLHD